MGRSPSNACAYGVRLQTITQSQKCDRRLQPQNAIAAQNLELIEMFANNFSIILPYNAKKNEYSAPFQSGF